MYMETHIYDTCDKPISTSVQFGKCDQRRVGVVSAIVFVRCGGRLNITLRKHAYGRVRLYPTGMKDFMRPRVE